MRRSMPEREHVRPPPRRSASRSCNTRTGNCGVQTTFCVRHVRFHPGGARPQTEVLNACIDQHRNTYVGGLICKVLQIAPSTYRRHAARHRNPELRSAHAKHDEVLMLHIERVWQANMQVYGAEKVWKQMNHEDIVVAHCAVGRLKRRLGLEGVRRGKTVRSTMPDTAAPCPLDRVNRQFQANRPNQLWVSDFTYLSTCQGWLYVAFVVGAFTRCIMDWHVSTTMTTEEANYYRQLSRQPALAA
ncbi:MAG: hypothetical protein DWQ09_16470 [Proteobacteria bacterium]|nr:MAG: hypothetical protein DWQ09_16470 [Pseudomonadota bacterium]